MALVLLSGITGSLKKAVANTLQEKYGYGRVTSVTTREPMEFEQSGDDYCFASQYVFDRMVERGLFMESTNHRGKSYGVTKAKLLNVLEEHTNAVLIMTPDGVAKLRKYLAANNLPHVAVYLESETLDSMNRLTHLYDENSLSRLECVNRVTSVAKCERHWNDQAKKSSTFDIIIEMDDDADDTADLIESHVARLNKVKGKQLA